MRLPLPVQVLFIAATAIVSIANLAADNALAADGVTAPVTPKSRTNPLKQIWSGTRFSSESARALQSAPTENPANGVLADGRLIWKRPDGEHEKSCQTCHSRSSFSMRSAGTRYPLYYKPWKKIMNLEQRINRCRSAYMRAKPWPVGSKSMVAMTTYVRHQSRRTPVRVQVNGRARPFFKRGELAYNQRIGQANMSCADCHETYQAKRLGAQILSQGQSNGFPAHVLSAGGVLSLHQQFQRCNIRVAAEPLELGADDYVNLELYLAWRGQGLPVETPAVRD